MFLNCSLRNAKVFCNPFIRMAMGDLSANFKFPLSQARQFTVFVLFGGQDIIELPNQSQQHILW